MTARATDLKKQLVLAALECSSGDLDRTFTFEELLVKAWEIDPVPWGLRGFERQHPDSERLHRELDSRGKGGRGLVQMGLLHKVRPRVYRLTHLGLSAASDLAPSDVVTRERVDRSMEAEIGRILGSRAFQGWLVDHSKPKYFRDAGQFWGVAPGTPPRVIRERIEHIDAVIDAAQQLLAKMGVDEVGNRSRHVAFDRTDLDRASEFQNIIKERFLKELELLGAR